MFLAYSLKVELRKTNIYVINRSGYTVNHYHKSFCDAYAIRGTCPPVSVTHFSGHTYIRMREALL